MCVCLFAWVRHLSLHLLSCGFLSSLSTLVVLCGAAFGLVCFLVWLCARAFFVFCLLDCLFVCVCVCACVNVLRLACVFLFSALVLLICVLG